MTASVHIHSGSWPRPRLGTLQTARNVNRGWRLGDFTGASFEVSRDDPAFSILAERDLLSLLNMVVIEESGLPPWVGFIEKVNWGLKATGIQVEAKEAAQLLQERKTPKQFLVSENTSSAVRRVLLEANAQNPTGIFAATVEPGCLATVDLSSMSVADALDSLCEISGQEWWVEPAVSPSKVKLTLRVSSARGEDKTGSIVLREGQLVDAKYKLDGKNIVASLTIVGSSPSSSFALRPAATVLVEGKAESPLHSSEPGSVAGQVLEANKAQRDRLAPWLGPATARDLVDVSPQLSDDQTIAGLAVSRLDNSYRGPEEIEAVVSLSSGLLAGIVVGDTVGLEASSLGPIGISKSFRIQEMGVDDKAGTVTVRGHTEGGLTPRRGLRGLVRGLQEALRNLQRSRSGDTTTYVTVVSGGGGGGGGGGVTDHGALTGLADDDHPQYTTDAEADAIADGLIATHAGDADAHHAVYTDVDAVNAVEVVALLTLQKVHVVTDLKVNHILEYSASHGIDIDGVLCKDNAVETDAIRGLRETSGPTALTVGTITDGEYLKRVGATVVSGTPAGGGAMATDPLWDALGDLAYGTGADAGAKLAGNITTTKKFLRQVGNGAVSAAPAWDTIINGDLPGANVHMITGSFFAVPESTTVPKKRIGPMPFAGTFVKLTISSYDVAAESAIRVDLHKRTAANEDSNTSTTVFTTQTNRPTIAAGHYAGNTTTFEVSTFAKGDWLDFFLDVDDSGITVLDFGLEVTPT